MELLGLKVLSMRIIRGHFIEFYRWYNWGRFQARLHKYTCNKRHSCAGVLVCEITSSLPDSIAILTSFMPFQSSAVNKPFLASITVIQTRSTIAPVAKLPSIHVSDTSPLFLNVCDGPTRTVSLSSMRRNLVPDVSCVSWTTLYISLWFQLFHKKQLSTHC